MIASLVTACAYIASGASELALSLLERRKRPERKLQIGVDIFPGGLAEGAEHQIFEYG